MAHLLYRLGASALRHRHEGGKLLNPLISRDDAMRLREQFYQEGLVWPYENIVPGPALPPPGVGRYLKDQKRKDEKKHARQQEIENAMAKMPQAIEDYRALRRIPWDEVTAVDRLLMGRRQIRDKYVKRRLAKAG